MVGFKTRIVPDQRTDKANSYYGPCAPLPPKTEQAWVREIYQGYEDTDTVQTKNDTPPTSDIVMQELPQVSPAWEAIPARPESNGPAPPLPSLIDQRFFVKGSPPEYFRSTLYEPDDPEEDSDNE